jgi:hypothetical protein
MKNIVIYGDSHSRLFEANTLVSNIIPDLKNYSVIVRAIDGASCVGFGKRQSTLNLRNRILSDLAEDKIDYLVLNFGQVDTELGLFYEKYVKKSAINISFCLERYVSIYVNFINDLPIDKNKLIIKGVNVTTLCFSQHRFLNYLSRIITENINCEDEKIVIKKDMRRDLNIFTDSFRTQIGLEFNMKLKLALEKIGVSYMDINSYLLDKSSNLIKLEYIYRKFDHHIVDSISSRCLHLNELLKVMRTKAIWCENYE